MRRVRAAARAGKWTVRIGCLLIVAGAACAAAESQSFISSFRAAQRAFNAGRYEEAARLYRRAADEATRIRDRDEAFFMQAYMLERLHKWPQARDAYRDLVATSPKGPRTARAAFDAALIEAEHANDDVGWEHVERALYEYPNHGVARHALELWAAHVADARGEPALRGELGDMLEQLRSSSLAQPIKYQIALSLQRSGEIEKARAQFLRTAREHPYPKGSLTDDALYHASELAEQLGQPRQAIADLRELLTPREGAMGGSYERPRFPQAQMRIARLYRERLGDRESARREFRVMYTRHGTSILADDAMWNAALISLELDDEGDACDIASAIRDREPASRYRRCLAELCEALEHPSGQRPCPRYLREQLPKLREK